METIEMAGTANFEKMTFPELIQTRDQLDAVIKARQTEALQDLHTELTHKAQQFGVTLEDVLQHAGKPHRAKRNIAPKYRDPENPQNTWAGRGRLPAWLQTHLDAGRDKHEFLID